jgi:protein O-GlcNAc transferase
MSNETAVVRANAREFVSRGNALEDQGRVRESLSLYESAIALDPGFPSAHLNRGNALLALGDTESALQSYRAAANLDPAYAAAHCNIGHALFRTGDRAGAIAAFERAIAVSPDFADAMIALGVALEDGNELEAAVAVYRKALDIAPTHAGALSNLGSVLLRSGEPTAAVATLARALEADPGSTHVHVALAQALVASERVGDALECLKRAVTLNPQSATALFELGRVQQRLRLLSEAVASYQRAIWLDPKLVRAHADLGVVCLWLGRPDDAIAHHRDALALDATFAAAHAYLADALRAKGLFEEASKAYRRAIELDPAFTYAHVNLGNSLWESGSIDDAQACYRAAIAIDPDLHEAYSGLLFCLSHDEKVDAGTLFAEHRCFGEHFEPPLAAGRPIHANVRDPRRKLRVGFVSADFCAHPVSYFVEPLFSHLANEDGLQLHAYSNVVTEDEVSAQLRRSFTAWERVAALSNDALARKIADDGIDILIDLSGHTHGNRLVVFARKPAPIQASWLGYPGTTGLAAMDYYFADPLFLPFDRFRNQFTEKLVHLPGRGPYRPPADAPAINALPALRAGYVTFGSFNRLNKVQAATLESWAALMRDVEASHLVLGASPAAGLPASIVAVFDRHGIDRSRLHSVPRTDIVSFLGVHHRVDVALDTHPYAGGTTALHSMWMGVPTLTVAGDTPAGHQGAAIMRQLGLHEFVADDARDFVRNASATVADLEALADIRAGMRERFAARRSLQSETMSRAMTRSLRIMWERWCAGLAPIEFDPLREKASRGVATD